jgi:hypothetical protein
MKKKKFLTKVNNLEDISVSVEYYKEKYYPDILKEKDLLHSIVEQIKLEPRILYDESYVKGWKDELTLERESKVKIVINLLQSVLNELENSSTLLSTKKNFERWTQAKNWLKAIFTAASSGSLSKLVYFGPDAENFPSDSKLLSEFVSLRSKIDKFFIKFYPYILDNSNKKRSSTIMLSKHVNTLIIDEALGIFATRYHKSYAPYSGSIAAKNFDEVDSVDKIVLHILANKYRTTFQSISMRMKLI